MKCLVNRKFWIPGASLFALMNLKHRQKAAAGGAGCRSSAPEPRVVMCGPRGSSMDHPGGGGGELTPLAQRLRAGVQSLHPLFQLRL